MRFSGLDATIKLLIPDQPVACLIRRTQQRRGRGDMAWAVTHSDLKLAFSHKLLATGAQCFEAAFAERLFLAGSGQAAVVLLRICALRYCPIFVPRPLSPE